MGEVEREPRTTTPLPGTHLSCALLTLLTVCMAWPTANPHVSAWVRAAYFALLAWFFWRAQRCTPELPGQPLRLVRAGFLVLFASVTVSALILASGLEHRMPVLHSMRSACEHGAMLLLGTTLLSYGIMLWIPHVLASHRQLGDRYRRQSGALQAAESARSDLEARLVDADRRGMLGELAASIAHDLRNPLTIVKGTAESLCRKARSPAEIAEHTAIIRRNVDKADRTIMALIDLARPRRKEIEPCAPSALLHEVAELARIEARRRRVELVIQGTATEPPVRTDRTAVVQVLLNLVLNAIQATTGPGTVALTSRVHRGRLLFLVADRGIGLPADVRQRLFTPFFTTKPTGTGLGLTSCRRIAVDLGGAMRLQPRHRGGARAMLALPLTIATDDASGGRTAPVDAERACTAPIC